MLADDDNDTSRWRNSVHGFFRATSASPDWSLRTGTARVATAVLGLGIQHSNSLKTSFTMSISSPGQGVVRLVRVNDFADSDTSNNSMYTDEEILSAENIYAVIQEYEEGQHFRFEENFLSDSDSDRDDGRRKLLACGDQRTDKSGQLEGGANRTTNAFQGKDPRERSLGLAHLTRLPISPLPATNKAVSRLVSNEKLMKESEFPDKSSLVRPPKSLIPKIPPSTPTSLYPEPDVTLFRSDHTNEDNLDETALGGIDITTTTEMDISEYPMDTSEYPMDTSEYPMDISEHPMDISEHPMDISEQHMDISEHPMDISEHPIDPTGVTNMNMDSAGTLNTNRDSPYLPGSPNSHNNDIQITRTRGSTVQPRSSSQFSGPQPYQWKSSQSHSQEMAWLATTTSDEFLTENFHDTYGQIGTSMHRDVCIRRTTSPNFAASPHTNASLSNPHHRTQLNSERSSFDSKWIHGGISNTSSSKLLGVIAGDSQAELPVMVYSVEHRESNSQWSAYEKQKTMMERMEMPQAPMPTYLGPRSGSNSPRSISILSTNIDISSRNNRSMNDMATKSTSGLLSSHPSPKFSSDSKWPREISRGQNDPNVGDSDLPILAESPDEVTLPVHSTQVHPQAFSVVQDTITKQQHHKHMISNEMISKDIIRNDITSHNEKKSQYRQMAVGSNDASWTKWVSMMVIGLVAVPIYFMVTFGFFDHGGYYEYTLDRTLNEKDTDVQLRYFLRYTRTQKVLSSVIGIIWILMVLAMIGVGFGLSVGK